MYDIAGGIRDQINNKNTNFKLYRLTRD